MHMANTKLCTPSTTRGGPTQSGAEGGGLVIVGTFMKIRESSRNVLRPPLHKNPMDPEDIRPINRGRDYASRRMRLRRGRFNEDGTFSRFIHSGDGSREAAEIRAAVEAEAAYNRRIEAEVRWAERQEALYDLRQLRAREPGDYTWNGYRWIKSVNRRHVKRRRYSD